MSNLKDYTCPRCDYKTRIKNDMRRHFYSKKKTCPGQTNNILLTDAIMKQVLDNRVYELPVVENDKCKMNLHNVVVGMDTKEKIDCVLSYENNKLINFGDQIESVHGQTIKKLDDRSYKYGFKLGHHDLLELVDASVIVSSHNNIQHMNVLYVQELNKIAIFHDDEWTQYLFDNGINKVISIIRNYYLESYEKYMLYKIFVDKNVIAQEANNYKNMLNEYFRFLAVFDIFPCVKDERNEDCVPGFNHEKVFYLSDFCMDRYNEQKEQLSKSETNKLRKHIGDIIKLNNGANVRMLNNQVINLAVNDQNFKEYLLSHRCKLII